MTLSESMYVKWWEPYFDHHVIVCLDGANKYIKMTDLHVWITEHYPDVEIDPGIRGDKKPYFEYDGGFTSTFDSNYVIFYFKDASIATHFKLVWG